ncbi:IS1/IS1595 family N-terminal zinc-binding domain-containing protein, partial [Moraxella catarrhalis]
MSFVKAGLGNGKQRYKCKGCNHYFSVKQRSNQKSNDIKKQAIDTNSKQILGFVCGKTDTNTFKRLY